MLQQIFQARLILRCCSLSGSSFTYYIFNFAVSRVGARFCCVFTRRQRGKSRGRLTLNPISHIDIVGALAMIFVGFGWAKPVPINPNNFKNQSWVWRFALLQALWQIFLRHM